MKLGRRSFARVLVLAAFVAFQAVQSLHRHRTVAAEDNCAVCQVIHHTPSTSAPAASSVAIVFTFQPFVAVSAAPAVSGSIADAVRSRAPPAA